jgi:hypothetical protein
MALVEHGVGLPHSRSGAEVYTEVAGCLDSVGTILGPGGLNIHQMRVAQGVSHSRPEPTYSVIAKRTNGVFSKASRREPYATPGGDASA